jgi:hypothetical protein
MARKLRSFVHVYDERGNPHAFGPDDKVPAWASKQMGDHVWEGSDEPDGHEVDVPEDDGEVGSEPITDAPKPAEDKSPAVRRRGTAH